MGLQNWMTIRVSSHDILIMVEYKLKTNLWFGICIKHVKFIQLETILYDKIIDFIIIILNVVPNMIYDWYNY